MPAGLVIVLVGTVNALTTSADAVVCLVISAAVRTDVGSVNTGKELMRRIRQVLIHCAYIAALIDVGACGSEDGLGSSPEVQASGESQSLFWKKHHLKKKKKKHHWDDCAEDAGTSDDAGTRMCQSLALHTDSLKHREDTQKAEGTINVRVPEALSSYFWGKRLEAQLTFQQGDQRVVCTYAARHHRRGEVSSSLELDSCDNGAKAGDSIAIDSASLSLDCSRWVHFAKVWVEIHEVEPCGETPMTPECDPADVDDDNPCTRDFCGDNGVEHEPLARGTSCADDNVCNGEETCDGQGACQNGDAPPPPPLAGPCQTRSCDAQNGWVLTAKAAGTSCADDDVCNGQETCSAYGTCSAGTPLTCGDDNACNGEEQCDPQAGCVAGEAPDADDANPCTTDACDPVSGVTHVPVQTDDNNACTTDACDPMSGVTHVPVQTDDNNACTTDACDPMNGVTHVPVQMDDNNMCTADACDPTDGVMHTPTMEGAQCGSSAFCQDGQCVMFN